MQKFVVEQFGLLKIMQELFDRFQLLGSEYSSLKVQCESEIKQWQWATSPLFDLRPFYYERHRYKPGRIIKRKPINLAGKYQYGYDLLGRVIVKRQYVQIKIDSQASYLEEFYLYKEDSIESALFSYNQRKDPINCQRYIYQETQIISSESYAQRGASREYYHWEDDKIILIEVEHSDLKDSSVFVEPIPSQRIEPKYYSDGSLKSLTQYYDFQSDGSVKKFNLYQKLDDDKSFQRVLDLSKDILIKHIIETVIALKLEESVYCIAISYSPEQFSGLPSIWLGLNREREEWLRDYGKEAKYCFWNPAEFSVCPEINYDDDLSKMFSQIGQECSLKERSWDAIYMLNKVAKFLGTYDWSNTLSISPDFVVFVCDFDAEGTDIPKNFNYSVSSKLRQQFRAKDWLP